MTETRTKRRYAHELYPHPEDGEIRPLTVDVPYLYARALGFEVQGTGWYDATELAATRTHILIDSRQIALMADAMLQGLTGDEAWQWVEGNASDETGEIVGDRARHYGVDWAAIKPYPCGPEPDYHRHLGDLMPGGWRESIRVAGRESECPDCTEPVEGVSS